ncbi:MAG TPA: hypothetical protein VEY51_04335, partial [Chondromyces sp.]|nr:hypothetical protein [Chondromyces sp.]
GININDPALCISTWALSLPQVESRTSRKSPLPSRRLPVFADESRHIFPGTYSRSVSRSLSYDNPDAQPGAGSTLPDARRRVRSLNPQVFLHPRRLQASVN